MFGLEAAGFVSRVGADVDPDELKVGDRVFCLCRHDGLSTYTTTLAVTCVRIPNQLSFDNAGTMLIPYVTAIYSLMNVGHVAMGEVSETTTQRFLVRYTCAKQCPYLVHPDS